jgi:quinol monooxygenase YgiN
MHARIGTLHVHTRDDFEHVLQIMRDRVMPAAQRQPGCNAFLVMGNREEGKVLGLSLWETEEEMRASESGEYLQEQVSRVITLLRRPPEFEDYEVAAIS